MADSPIKSPEESFADEQRVEELAHELAERLRTLPNRTELTDYAVGLLRDSAEEANQAEQAHQSVERLRKGDPFNPIAFAIPLFVIGVVLCATGILIGPGMGIMGIAVLMALYGIGLALFRGIVRGGTKAKKQPGPGA